jgi:hypothetical protein
MRSSLRWSGRVKGPRFCICRKKIRTNEEWQLRFVKTSKLCLHRREKTGLGRERHRQGFENKDITGDETLLGRSGMRNICLPYDFSWYPSFIVGSNTVAGRTTLCITTVKAGEICILATATNVYIMSVCRGKSAEAWPVNGARICVEWTATAYLNRRGNIILGWPTRL